MESQQPIRPIFISPRIGAIPIKDKISDAKTVLLTWHLRQPRVMLRDEHYEDIDAKALPPEGSKDWLKPEELANHVSVKTFQLVMRSVWSAHRKLEILVPDYTPYM